MIFKSVSIHRKQTEDGKCPLSYRKICKCYHNIVHLKYLRWHHYIHKYSEVHVWSIYVQRPNLGNIHQLSGSIFCSLQSFWSRSRWSIYRKTHRSVFISFRRPHCVNCRDISCGMNRTLFFNYGSSHCESLYSALV